MARKFEIMSNFVVSEVRPDLALLKESQLLPQKQILGGKGAAGLGGQD